jgi:hypothetical protein
LPEDCIEIILFKALLEVQFPRHRVQRFTHMLDCHNLNQTVNLFAAKSKSATATEKQSNLKATTMCTSVVQKGHIDYYHLLPSILNLDGRNRETIFWNLPLSFVIGIDEDCSLRFHTSLNEALLNNRIKAVFSIKGKQFNQKLDQKYPMMSVTMKPGQIAIFAGTSVVMLI